jgi:hypothetical protein
MRADADASEGLAALAISARVRKRPSFITSYTAIICRADVGGGAGAQSRATDTHLVLRPHEEDNVVVRNAAVRTWAPIVPMWLRLAYLAHLLENRDDFRCHFLRKRRFSRSGSPVLAL